MPSVEGYDEIKMMMIGHLRQNIGLHIQVLLAMDTPPKRKFSSGSVFTQQLHI